MVSHEAEGMDPVLVFLYAFLQQTIEAGTVGRTEEDVLPAIATEHDVVYSAWKMDAGFACHGKKLHLIYPKVKPDPIINWIIGSCDPFCSP